jgi:hypothetical protein
MNTLRDLNLVAAMQWDYEKNGDITPTYPDIADMWDYDNNTPDIPESEIATKTASKGLCPRYDGKSVFTPGLNDLEKTHPEILKYWNYDKNIVKPKEV